MDSVISITKESITVDSVKAHTYKAGINQVQIRQLVAKTYPKSNLANSISDSLFAPEPGKSFQSTRVAWINVPDTVNVQAVEQQLATMPKACIKQIYSHRPILSDEDIYAIANIEDVDEDVFANSQICRYGEGNDANKPAGELILHNDLPIYKRHVFCATAQADEDKRASNYDDAYITEDLALEIKAIVTVDETQKSAV